MLKVAEIQKDNHSKSDRQVDIQTVARDRQETGQETEQTTMVIREIGRYKDMNRDKQETGQETEQITMSDQRDRYIDSGRSQTGK